MRRALGLAIPFLIFFGLFGAVVVHADTDSWRLEPDQHFGTRCIEVAGPSNAFVDVCSIVNTNDAGNGVEALIRVSSYDLNGHGCAVVWDYARLKKSNGVNLGANETNDTDVCFTGENISTIWASPEGGDACYARGRWTVQWDVPSYNVTRIVDSFIVNICNY